MAERGDGSARESERWEKRLEPLLAPKPCTDLVIPSDPISETNLSPLLLLPCCCILHAAGELIANAHTLVGQSPLSIRISAPSIVSTVLVHRVGSNLYRHITISQASPISLFNNTLFIYI